VKNDFLPFSVGTVFNPLPSFDFVPSPTSKSLLLQYPSRLNAMALDPSRITTNNNLVYQAGEVVLSIALFRRVRIQVVSGKGGVLVGEGSRNPILIRHATEIMRTAIGFRETLAIDLTTAFELRHAGLGSSSGTIAAVAAAINELYGRPIDLAHLRQYVAQNHGEEIDGDENHLMPVQCLGGSAAAGMCRGSVLIIAGKSSVISAANLDEKYQIVIGVPRDFTEMDAKIALQEEVKHFPDFARTGHEYGPIIAYRLVHECLPALSHNDIRPLGELIFDYRFRMGSIKNCAFMYPRIIDIANELEELKKEGKATILGLSSVGPAMFAVTEYVPECVEKFEAVGLHCVIIPSWPDTYKVLTR